MAFGGTIYYERTEYNHPVEPVVVQIEVKKEEPDIETLIRETFPEEPDVAVAIAKAESNLKPWAYNPELHRGCAGSVGVMQIACVHYDGDPRDLHDVALNLQIARAIYEQQGWEPWGAYTNLSYTKHLAHR